MRPSQLICDSDALAECGAVKFAITYRGQPAMAILIRHQGVAYGYLNLCVHMPKSLDCECPEVFDETGRYLRCSMHGITYDPATGECQSEICAGKSLTGLRIEEQEGRISLRDKRAALLD